MTQMNLVTKQKQTHGIDLWLPSRGEERDGLGVWGW